MIICSISVCVRLEEKKEADLEKEAAVEAELRAARERAVVPQETRMNQFKDMLLERGVKQEYFLKHTLLYSLFVLTHQPWLD